MQTLPLAGRKIAVPETREIEVFAALLERRGASVIRCPLVGIHDAPDPAPVLQWCRAFAGGACQDLVLLTGEGLRRLLSCIEQHEPALREHFVQALARTRKITRGPKPARALRELGLKPELPAATPTTEGVIEALRSLNLAGHCVGVQLYGTDPNRPLIDYLQSAGASVLAVAPYVYADETEDRQVRGLLEQMHAGEIDAIAFTSTPQVRRLFSLASPDYVRAALSRTLVAVVGPVVAERLTAEGVAVQLMPQDAFFLKPLTATLEAALAKQGAG